MQIANSFFENYPLESVFTLLEEAPVCLITTGNMYKSNIMTLTWQMPISFDPALIVIMSGPWNASYNTWMETKELTLCVTSADLLEKCIEIGNCSGKEVDKWKKFQLTPIQGEIVSSPLVLEAVANIECQVVKELEYGLIVLKPLKAWVSTNLKNEPRAHAVGDGRFKIDGKTIYNQQVKDALPEHVQKFIEEYNFK